VGRYTVSRAQCGADTADFTLHVFKTLDLLEDGVGYDGLESGEKGFEWVVIDDKLEVCYTTNSNSIEIPFKISGDTLILSRSNQFCPKLKVYYVRD